MNFRTVTRTYNRLSLPKKVATGVAAIAGVGALIGIPVLTFNPVRPPTVLNEDAYYQSRVSNPSSLEGNSDRAQGNFDSATPADIATDSSKSTNIPGIGEFGGSAKTFDTSETPSNIGENSPYLSNIAGNASITNNPYSRSSPSRLGSSRYSPPDSLSANVYNASSPGSSTLSTPYSLPVPKPATPYSLQPSQGNIYPDLNNKTSPGSQRNSATGIGTPPTIPSP
ncbi:MAG TPA: hypothetical protein V6D09_02060 [Leptolyngbyaceae cyanobacterium]